MSKKYDIGACHKGNGTTIYNRAEEENNDFKNVAHISEGGVITYYEDIPERVKRKIEIYNH